MKDRTITLATLDELISEKEDLYREWFSRGIIDEKEFKDRSEAMNSLKGLALFHAKKTLKDGSLQEAK
jgi:hypothetical protein